MSASSGPPPTVLGVESVTFLGEPDGLLEVTPRTRKMVTREIRRLRPEVLVAPDPSRLWFSPGYINHWDHKQAGLLALTAVMPDAPTRVMFQELEDEGLEPFEVPNLYLGGNDPDIYIDITDTIDTKIAALAQHASEEGEAAAPWVRERARAGGRGERASSTPRPSRRSASWTTKKGRPADVRASGPRHPHMEPDDPIELTADERRDIEADLDDLSAMRSVFSPQSVKGVVVACQDCGANHYYEWELLRDNLEHMLSVGEPRMHEPPFEIIEEEYIQWDYGKGYVDALTDTGLEPDRRIEVTQCPWCKTPFGEDFAFCPGMRPDARHGAPLSRVARPRLRRA